MIFPDITTEEWCKRHPPLVVQRTNCLRCKNVVLTSIPFIEKDWVGLLSPPCTNCGEKVDFSTQYSPQGKLLNIPLVSQS